MSQGKEGRKAYRSQIQAAQSAKGTNAEITIFGITLVISLLSLFPHLELLCFIFPFSLSQLPLRNFPGGFSKQVIFQNRPLFPIVGKPPRPFLRASSSPSSPSPSRPPVLLSPPIAACTMPPFSTEGGVGGGRPKAVDLLLGGGGNSSSSRSKSNQHGFMFCPLSVKLQRARLKCCKCLKSSSASANILAPAAPKGDPARDNDNKQHSGGGARGIDSAIRSISFSAPFRSFFGTFSP